MNLREMKRENNVLEVKKEKERCQTILYQIIKLSYHCFLIYFFLLLFFLGQEKRVALLFITVTAFIFFIWLAICVYLFCYLKISKRRINEMYVEALLHTKDGMSYIHLGDLRQYKIYENKKYMILSSKKKNFKRKNIFIQKHFSLKDFFIMYDKETRV